LQDRASLDDAERSRVAEVFETHSRFVEAVAMTEVNGDHAEAAEVVQEVAVRLCRHLNGLRDPAAIRSWIYKLTIHTARDRRDSKKSEGAAVDRMVARPAPTPILDPDAVVLEGERRAALSRAIRQLPATERRVIRRRFGIGRTAADGEKTLEEVGQELALSREGVRKAQDRAFERLRRSLGNRRRRLL
jgi:RNA polymerase sigma factor (sigma-70 family)